MILSDRERAIYESIDRKRPRCCVLCAVGIRGGDNLYLSHHHIIPRSHLPGQSNWACLWKDTNIALACGKHHERYGHQLEIWQSAMISLGFAIESDYA